MSASFFVPLVGITLMIAGALLIQSPHALNIDDAAAHGYCRVNKVTSGSGCTAKSNDVTTPKLPPPPP